MVKSGSERTTKENSNKTDSARSLEQSPDIEKISESSKLSATYDLNGILNRRDPGSLLALQSISGNQAVSNHIAPKTRLNISKASPAIQTKSLHSSSPSFLEKEADSVADQIVGKDINRYVDPNTIDKDSSSSYTSAIPNNTTDAVRNSLGRGKPLESTIKQSMESRFGHDFSSVRIRHDETANKAAESINANAFTFGNQIQFRAGNYSPNTPKGQHLLAHELTHVLQQRGGSSQIQRQETNDSNSGSDNTPGVNAVFSLNVTRIMNADETLIEFVMQYRSVDAAQAEQLIESEEWQWSNEPRQVTQEDVDRGYIIIHVRDRSIEPIPEEERDRRREEFDRLSRSQRSSINQETYRRFRSRSQYEGPLDSNSDPRLRNYWHQIRDELLRQREAVNNLPEPIRDFIFNGGGNRITPSNYEDVLRIAELLANMSESERQAYLDSTTATTTDLGAFEQSLTRFIEQLDARREASIERESAKADLLTLSQIYDQYRVYVGLRDHSHRSTAWSFNSLGSGDEMMRNDPLGSIGWSMVAQNAADELREALRQHDYDSIPEFEAAIRRFRNAFRDEAVLIAEDMMRRYEHVLWTQEQRYSESANVTQLHGQLDAARDHLTTSDARMSSMMGLGRGMNSEYGRRMSREYMENRQAAWAQAEALEEDHPLFSDNSFPVESIIRASGEDLGGNLLRYIQARRTDIQNTRRNLTENPDLVWELDQLVAIAKVEQNISPNSIYDKIIRDHQRDRTLDQAMINLAIAVIAIAAGLISAGGGTVAILGGVTAFGISGFQAYEEFRRYEVMHAAHGAQLVSDDPSFAWVVVALIGAGFDAAGVAVALRSGSGLTRAVSGFNRTRNIDELTTALNQLDELNAAARANVLRAARAETAADTAWEVARRNYFGRAYAVIDPLVTPLLNLAVHFTYPMYMSLRQGIIGVERFLLTRRIVNLVGDFRQLNPAQVARLRQAYQIALTNAQRVAAHAHSLGLLDQEIERFLLLWNRTPSMTADDMIEQLNHFASPLARRSNARSRIAPEMIMDDASRARLGNDFDQQIAGTGGIERITVVDAPQGHMAVTIEGEILPQRLTREPANVTPTRRRAPDFNSRYPISAGDLGLSGTDWHRLHLWGPGFGDEAAAGMFWGPSEINLVWQNRSVESRIRELGQMAAERGGRVRVRATAVSWESPTPGGFIPRMGENFLKEVEYDIVLVRPGMSNTTVRVTIEVAEPPATGIRSFSIDPPHAINLGDLF